VPSQAFRFKEPVLKTGHLVVNKCEKYLIKRIALKNILTVESIGGYVGDGHP
jgi:hypothetical protein